MDLGRLWRLRWIIAPAAILWTLTVLTGAAFYRDLVDVQRDGGEPAEPQLWISGIVIVVGTAVLAVVWIWWMVALRRRSRDHVGVRPFARITAVVTVALVAFDLGLVVWVGVLATMFPFDHNRLTAPFGVHHVFVAV